MRDSEIAVRELLRGKYELLELAGTGGMAEVFRAVAHGAAGFRRAVAVKRVLDQYGHDEDFLTMFVEEARVGSELDHPNIVQIHDFDVDASGRYFLVMEWIEGINLDDWNDAYRHAGVAPPWWLVTAIGIEILKGLGAAHERKLVDGTPAPVYHRDVNLQNMLLSRSGIVKVTDFGLARAMDRARITRPNILKGKLSYTAPELVRGEDPTARTDLFAVGVVLWEIFAGQKLFKAETPIKVLETVRRCEVPSLAELRPDLPPELCEVVHTALAKDPETRYRSARAMVRALANILRLTPTSTGAEHIARSVAHALELTKEQKRAKEEAKRAKDEEATLGV